MCSIQEDIHLWIDFFATNPIKGEIASPPGSGKEEGLLKQLAALQVGWSVEDPDAAMTSPVIILFKCQSDESKIVNGSYHR